MRKSLVVLLLAAVVAPVAQAKGPGWTALRFCGESGCRTVKDEALIQMLFVRSGERGGRPPAPTSYYIIEPLPDYSPSYYVPSADVVRTFGLAFAQWHALDDDAARFERAVRGIEPFSAPRVSAALVDRRPVREPESYRLVYELRSSSSSSSDPLHELLGSATSIEPENDFDIRAFWREWIPVDLESARPSPWTDDWSFVWISRHGNRLARDGETIEIPTALADQIRRREPLRLERSSTSNWRLIGGAGAALAVAIGLIALLRKRFGAT